MIAGSLHEQTVLGIYCMNRLQSAKLIACLGFGDLLHVESLEVVYYGLSTQNRVF